MTTADQRIKETEQDIEELKTFLAQSKRESVKKSIQVSLNASEEELDRLQRSEKQRLERQTALTTIGITKKIDTYGWDQSEKFVKVYITSLKDVSQVKEADVSTNFAEKSCDLTIKNLNNTNYNFVINNLCFKIVPEQSYFKLKKDMISVFLRKADTGKEWPGMTEKELKEHEKKMASAPKMDDKADPQDGMMSMMKKMYDEGDDEMKRTISKSFMESREKQAKGGDAGGMGGMPGMSGMGGGAGGMPDLGSMMGGMGGAGGADGKPDMSKLMSMMGGLGGGAGKEGGAGGMDMAKMMAGMSGPDGKPDMSKLMSMMGGLGGGAGKEGEAGGMDMAKMMAAMGKGAGADIE